MAFRSRLVSCVVIGGRFHMQEETGTRIPLNREGYGSIANAVKGLERYYEVVAVKHDCEYRLVRVRDSHKLIAPRDLGFVDRMIVHELNEEDKAKRPTEPVNAGPIVSAPLEGFEFGDEATAVDHKTYRFAAGKVAEAVIAACIEASPAPECMTEVLPVSMTDPVARHVVAADGTHVTVLAPRLASPRTWYADLNPHRGMKGEKPWRVFWRDEDGTHMTGIRGSRRKCERWAASANEDDKARLAPGEAETPSCANVEGLPEGWTIEQAKPGSPAAGLWHAYRNGAKTDDDVTVWCRSKEGAAAEARSMSV